MIDLLTLKNFQIYSNATFHFVPRINVITGFTEQGKSSLIRALYWFFNNSPSGDEFIRDNATFCQMILHANNHVFERIKSSTENKYVLDGEEFNAVRTDVPLEIKKAFPITETNIQMQDDPYFMLSLSPPEVARKLNRVVGLDVIDSSIKFVDSIRRENLSKSKNLKEEIEKKTKDLERFKLLPKLEKIHNKYKKYLEQIEELTRKDERLENFIYSIEKYKTEIKKEKYVNEAQELLRKTDEIFNHFQILSQQNKRIIAISNKIKKHSKIGEKDKIIKKINEIIQNLEEKYTTYETYQNKYSKVKTFINSIETHKKSVKTFTTEYTKAKSEKDKFEKEIGFCPLCGSPFQKEE